MKSEIADSSLGRKVLAFASAGAAALVSFSAATGLDASSTQSGDQDYGYEKQYLTDEQRNGRDTWYFWTAGNENFWLKMARLTQGNVNLLAYVDSRLHGRRFATLGAITQPGCRAGTEPDQYGLWMDRCDQPEVPGIPGGPSGIVGLRRFPNDKFDAAKWNADAFFKDPASAEPP